MTQTYRKWYNRNTCRISGNPKIIGGYDVVITRYTVAEFIRLNGGEHEVFIGPVLEALAKNGKGYFYRADAHNGARCEYFSSYSEARDFAESQFC